MNESSDRANKPPGMLELLQPETMKGVANALLVANTCLTHAQTRWLRQYTEELRVRVSELETAMARTEKKAPNRFFSISG